MRHYIKIGKSDRDFITQAFHCTPMTVYNALRYAGSRGETDLAQRIRRLALHRGGVEMVECTKAEFHEALGMGLREDQVKVLSD